MALQSFLKAYQRPHNILCIFILCGCWSLSHQCEHAARAQLREGGQVTSSTGIYCAVRGAVVLTDVLTVWDVTSINELASKL